MAVPYVNALAPYSVCTRRLIPDSRGDAAPKTGVKYLIDIFSFHLICNSYGYRDSECTKYGKRDCQIFELGLFNGVGEDALVKFLRVLFAHPPTSPLTYLNLITLLPMQVGHPGWCSHKFYFWI